MDRLLTLKNSEANSSRNSNTSVSSELGYETARDDSVSSMYYSMDEDDTVTSIDLSDHSQLAAIPATSSNFHHQNDAISSTQTPQTIENDPVASLYSNSVETESIEQIAAAIEPSENLDKFVDNSNSGVLIRGAVIFDESQNLQPESNFSSRDDVDQPNENLDPSVAFMRDTSVDEHCNIPSTLSTTSRECQDLINLNSNLNQAFTHTVPVVENLLQPLGLSMIPILPLIPEIPEISTIVGNGRNMCRSSSTVQEIYVVAVNTQEQTNEGPRKTRASRSTMVRFQTTDLPRRQTVMSRRTLGDTRNEVISSNRPATGPTNIGRKSTISTSHVCDICQKTFPLRSTLTIHKTSHKTNCQYCDRSFKKSFALSNHLKENCEKIPAAARRKLLAKEFNARK